MDYNIPTVGEWTQARYWTFIRSLLRRGWTKYPVKYEVLRAARRPSQRTENKRIKWEYQCERCEGWYLGKEVSVDHINPCGTLKRYSDLPRFCRNLFCSVGELQVLCKRCHDLKSYTERHNISWMEAGIRKQILGLLKCPAKEQRSILLSNGFTEDQINNQKKRKICFTIYVRRKK